MPSSALGTFLRTARERVAPELVGFERGPRRRTPGLRRQELAQLAGVSVEYLARLEQGRADHPSAAVVDALAGALRLGPIEHEHLRALADLAAPVAAATGDEPEPVSPRTRRLLELVEPMPAFVVNTWMDLLATNGPGSALLVAPHEPRNVVLRLFQDPAQRTLYPEWEQIATEGVGTLRTHTERHPDDPRPGAIAAALADDPDFARLWAGDRFREHTHGVKRFAHPEVGDLELTWQRLDVAEQPGQTFVLYTAEPGSPSAERVLRLGRRDPALPAA